MSFRARARSRGSAVVEFALVVTLLVLLVLGLLEFGRAFFKMNSAIDAVHRGARTAAIVAVGDSATVVGEMRRVFPELDASNVTVEYSSTDQFNGVACDAANCRFVRVTINYTFHSVAFFLPAEIVMPRFSATSIVEALGTT
jgi:Flp pilus assembly protein TadG